MIRPLDNPLRLQLGAQVRALRDRAGISAEALGERIGVSQSWVSRAEQGKSWPGADGVDKLLTALDADPVSRDRAEALVEAIQQGITTIRDLRPNPIHLRSAELGAIENRVNLVRRYEPLLVPDLLWSPDYARAVYASTCVDDPAADIARRVAAQARRVERAHRRSATPTEIVVTEAALRFVPNGLDAAQDQAWRQNLTHELALAVLKAARKARIEVRVIPAGQPAPVVAGGGFTLYTLDDGGRLAVAPTAGADVMFAAAETDRFAAAWNRAAAVALSPEASAEFVASLAATTA